MSAPVATSALRRRLGRFRSLRVLYGLAERVGYPAARHARAFRRRLFDRRRLARYVEGHHVRKLQLGAGPNLLPGWLNTDLHPDIYPGVRDKIVFLDARRPFPLPDASFDYVFSEHQIEHVAEAEGRAMLSECFRILRPGGRIRIATPDLAAIAGLYEEPLDEARRHYLDWVTARLDAGVRRDAVRAHSVNLMLTGFRHQFVYDGPALTASLEDAGFVSVTRHLPGESEDPALKGLEAHGRSIGDEAVNRFETVVLEAVRPEPPTTESRSA